MTGSDNFEEPSDIKDDWMIKNCLVYDEEYSDCKSIKARLNQWFIFGKTLNCDQWKRDSINCYKWVENKDKNAAIKKSRIKIQLSLCNTERRLHKTVTSQKKLTLHTYKYENISERELIESEKQRRRQRLLVHYKNDVWTRRKSPPENWNAPLPEYLQKEYENTYLNLKSKEMKGEIPPTFDPDIKFCTIL